MDEHMRGKAALRVGVACNLKTDVSSDEQAEFDEPETIEAICGALEASGYAPFVLEASRDFPHKIEAEKPDIVFNIAEGISGRSREAQIPAILDYYGIPYTGSDAAALAIALDKALTKRLAASIGVDTPAFSVISADDLTRGIPADFPFPVLIKPNAEGSSKGISDASVAANADELYDLAERTIRRCGGDAPGGQ